MAQTSLRSEIANTLDDLGPDEWEKFREKLIERRVEPRVRRAIVEKLTRAGLSNKLISTFTNVGAVRVTVEILKNIGCNQEAEDLESRTRNRITDPIFRWTLDKQLDLSPSDEAQQVQRNRPNINHFGILSGDNSPEKIKALAKAAVEAKGLNHNDPFVVLSEHLIIFEKYAMQTFKWVLENDVGFVVETVVRHQMEKEDRLNDLTSSIANKDALAQYAMSYPEVAELISFSCQQSRESNRASRAANHQFQQQSIQEETFDMEY